MLDYLLKLTSRLGEWSYLVVFLGATLESAAMLGLVVPGEALVLACAFLASRGAFDLDALFWTVAAGAAVGDTIGYELGRTLGRTFTDRHGGRFGITPERLDRADRFFEKHGPASVFLGRFVGFARALVPFLAGTSRMPYRTFLPFNVAGAVAWAGVLVLLGYFFGSSIHRLEAWIGHIALVGAALVGLTWLLRGRIRRPPALWLELGVLALAVFVFAAVAEDVATKDPLTQVDQQIATWWPAHRLPWLTQGLQLVSLVHGTWPVIAAVIALALWLARRHDRRSWLASLLVSVPVGMLMNVGLKHLFQRTRPVVDHPLVHLSTFSFPSGHVVAATLLYGFLCAFIVAHTRSRTLHLGVAATGIAMVGLVAFSRVYLGAHFLSDVLGAAALAAAWLTFVLSCVHGTLNRTVIERLSSWLLGDGRSRGQEQEGNKNDGT